MAQPASPFAGPQRSTLATIRSLLPYLWPRGDAGARVRVVIAAVFLVAAKAATVYVPIVYGRVVDALAPKGAAAMTAIPIALIVGYGLLRIGSSGLRGDARCGVRRRAAAHRAQGGAADLRASASAEPALPSRPPDRRARARARARHHRHRIGAAPGRVQHPARRCSKWRSSRSSCGACSTGASPRSRCSASAPISGSR